MLAPTNIKPTACIRNQTVAISISSGLGLKMERTAPGNIMTKVPEIMERLVTIANAQATVYLALWGCPAPRFWPTSTPEAWPIPMPPKFTSMWARWDRAYAATVTVPKGATNRKSTKSPSVRSRLLAEAGAPSLIMRQIILKSTEYPEKLRCRRDLPVNST